MTADLLRTCAALIRERAEAATPGPWEAGERIVWSEGVDASEFDNHIVSDGPDGLGGCVDVPDATHIASWHPAVALAVADWLDECAEIKESDANASIKIALTDRALKIARAYLGTPT